MFWPLPPRWTSSLPIPQCPASLFSLKMKKTARHSLVLRYRPAFPGLGLSLLTGLIDDFVFVGLSAYTWPCCINVMERTLRASSIVPTAPCHLSFTHASRVKQGETELLQGHRPGSFHRLMYCPMNNLRAAGRAVSHPPHPSSLLSGTSAL